jgi:hypothetical protein
MSSNPTRYNSNFSSNISDSVENSSNNSLLLNSNNQTFDVSELLKKKETLLSTLDPSILNDPEFENSKSKDRLSFWNYKWSEIFDAYMRENDMTVIPLDTDPKDDVLVNKAVEELTEILKEEKSVDRNKVSIVLNVFDSFDDKLGLWILLNMYKKDVNPDANLSPKVGKALQNNNNSSSTLLTTPTVSTVSTTPNNNTLSSSTITVKRMNVRFFINLLITYLKDRTMDNIRADHDFLDLDNTNDFYIQDNLEYIYDMLSECSNNYYISELNALLSLPIMYDNIFSTYENRVNVFRYLIFNANDDVGKEQICAYLSLLERSFRHDEDEDENEDDEEEDENNENENDNDNNNESVTSEEETGDDTDEDDTNDVPQSSVEVDINNSNSDLIKRNVRRELRNRKWLNFKQQYLLTVYLRLVSNPDLSQFTSLISTEYGTDELIYDESIYQFIYPLVDVSSTVLVKEDDTAGLIMSYYKQIDKTIWKAFYGYIMMMKGKNINKNKLKEEVADNPYM